MPNISNDWLKIEPSAGDGNTTASVAILEVNFSRTATRSASITGTTTHGATAHATITQRAYGPYIDIDYISDSNDQDISDFDPPFVVPAEEGRFTINGYANTDHIVIVETSDKEYTNINDEEDPYHPEQFILIDSSLVSHIEPLGDELSQDFGVSGLYNFEITFVLRQNETSTQRAISIVVSDGSSQERSASDTITFYQAGAT